MIKVCLCCGGTGYDPLDSGQCDECNGTGIIETDDEVYYAQINVNEDYDRQRTDKDGTCYYGYDDEEDGTTAWYDGNGYLDSVSETPDEFEQIANEEGWL